MGSAKDGTPVEKVVLTLEVAERLYLVRGDRIAEDAALTTLTAVYRSAIAGSLESIKDSGMVPLCSACAQKVPGGCCFRQVAEWYDPGLLLINRLLGVSLPDRREVAETVPSWGKRDAKFRAAIFSASTISAKS